MTIERENLGHRVEVCGHRSQLFALALMFDAQHALFGGQLVGCGKQTGIKKKQGWERVRWEREREGEKERKKSEVAGEGRGGKGEDKNAER